MPVLSVIMREAEAMGLRPEGSNPCRGIRRYRRKGRERFLSDAEIRRLSGEAVGPCRAATLAGGRDPPASPDRVPQERDPDAALVGLPRTVISFSATARPDPRTVWLSRPARNILDSLERTGRWVFPVPGGDRPRSTSWLDRFWCGLRVEAELDDARLHDLRHTHASIALKQGETVLAIGKLLGHASPETTLKYTHSADAMAIDAAETVGALLGGRP